jgi:hypothetical protein
MSGLSDTTGTLNNAYSPYLRALRDAGATTLLIGTEGLIVVGWKGSNYILDVAKKKEWTQWYGIITPVDSVEQAISVVTNS